MHKKTILIIDDNESIIETLRLNLENKEYKVVCAFDGEEGLSTALNDPPDLILLDINMPKVTGDAVYGALKILATTNNIPIIIISGLPLEEIVEIARKRGLSSNDIVLKPFVIKDLISKINSYLE